MNKITATIEFVTPCMMAGTDQTAAEIRPQSIRGQLRWWYRLLNPGQSAREQEIFGGVAGKARASSVIVRVKPPAKLEIATSQTAEDIAGSNFDYFLWPLGRRNSTHRGVIRPGQFFELRLSHKNSHSGKPVPEKTVKAFLLLGSLGTRQDEATEAFIRKA